jgi:hypothetical protein
VTETSKCWTRISEREWSMVKRSADRAFKGTLGNIGPEYSKGSPLSRPGEASPPYFSPNTNALTIPQTNAHLTHPQNYGARQAQA